MPATIATLMLALVVGQPPLQDRPRNSIVPSLPELTDKEQAAIEQIIDRFIDVDIGKLKGKEADKALGDFKALGPECSFNWSRVSTRPPPWKGVVPPSSSGASWHKYIQTSRDKDLLDFVRENAGAGVKAKRHQGTIQDVKLASQFRKAALQREELIAKKAGSSAPKAFKAMTLPELLTAAAMERGSRLKEALTELATRDSDQVLPALTKAAKHYEADVKQVAQNLLVRRLSHWPSDQLKLRFKDESPEMRQAAAQVVGSKKYRLGEELIGLLEDAEGDVRQAARQALVRLSGGLDYGPVLAATVSERAAAMRQWRDWWVKSSGR